MLDSKSGSANRHKIPAMPIHLRTIVFFTIVLVLNFSQSAQAQPSTIEDDYLVVPRIDVDDSEPFSLLFRIEFNGEYLFILDHVADVDPNANSSGNYDTFTQSLVFYEIELENGDLYSATLELVSESPDIVFRLADANLKFSPSDTADLTLPIRPGVRPRTTSDVPHTQIGVDLVPEVNTELFRRVFSVPGIEQHVSSGSFSGTQGLWLAEDIPNLHPGIITGQEFGHIHPDGSLHITLDPERAAEAVQARWAIFHPWSDQSGREGLVMLYTPQSLSELDTVFQLIVDAFNYFTGQNIQATDYY
jgi:hypothetical protein